ncbi:hypothetical protein HK099_003663 [Clydaea vesicula]|uniref:NADP-dependent oxidoreductase domain-containing protein n=1 Tax=Clydaea vesicula TaxID=447962 RepID=A0AAD5U4N1_9FUNG|nr:hypothetical protein HK099_003663 [Clydaea vesicula]KAJ3397292.1 hypothetical protein HDU92_008833 [Lobulomyces angularis]
MKKFTLNNGTQIPAIAFGIGTKFFRGQDQNHAPDDLDFKITEAVKTALKTGYTHLDNAEVYGNELEVGLALHDPNVKRSDLYITSKLLKNIKDPKNALNESLQRLNTSYLDLYLIHAPFFSEESHGISLEDAWKQLEGLVDAGVVKSIGVSNFRIRDLERILKICRIKPTVNQIEYHAYLQSRELVQFCKENQILVAAYGPLTPIFRKPDGPLGAVLEKLSKKYSVKPEIILLRWVYQQGILVVTTSSNPERQKEVLSYFQENKDKQEFALSTEDMDEISTVGATHNYRHFWKNEEF